MRRRQESTALPPSSNAQRAWDGSGAALVITKSVEFKAPKEVPSLLNVQKSGLSTRDLKAETVRPVRAPVYWPLSQWAGEKLRSGSACSCGGRKEVVLLLA